MKVLVVEDEPRLAEALVQLLRDGGWQAEAAHTGPDGLELARIRALARRQGEPPVQELAYADLRLDPATHALSRGKRSVRLSPREFDLLLLLMRSPGTVCPKGAILDRLWGGQGAEDNNVEAYISFLRKKFFYLGSRAEIATLRKVGYRLENPEER